VRLPRLLVVPALVAVLLGSAAAANASSTAADGPRPLAALDEQIPPEQGPQGCRGLNQEAALVAMNDTPTVIGETGVFVGLPDSTIDVTVPNNDTDQIIVTFTAESELTGQPVTYTPPVDIVQLQLVIVNAAGVQVLAPLNGPTFTSDVGQANALQACRRLSAGTYTVGVRWRIVDVGMMNALTASLDDWVLHVEVNN
jgi:hypothetical protein